MEHTGNRGIKDAGDMEDTRDMEGFEDTGTLKTQET